MPLRPIKATSAAPAPELPVVVAVVLEALAATHQEALAETVALALHLQSLVPRFLEAAVAAVAVSHPLERQLQAVELAVQVQHQTEQSTLVAAAVALKHLTHLELVALA